MPASKQAAARKELDLLVQTGLGVEPLAPTLARLLRELIGAEGCFIGWFDENGVPAGFFHDSAPVSAEELFLNNSELFIGPDELNIFWLMRDGGSAVGNMMNPGKAFFRSNTFNLLFKACHHHHGLDLRVHVEGRIRLAIGLFRAEPQPFSDDDAHRLYSLVPTLQMAAVKMFGVAGSTGTHLETGNQGESGHLLISPDSSQIIMISEQATNLLKLAKLFGQGIWLTADMTIPPQFILRLCAQLTAGVAITAQCSLNVAGGALVITASWIQVTTGSTTHEVLCSHRSDADRNILVQVDFRKPAAISIVRSISQLELSPLQSRIAMFAATGGSRIDCAAHHRVSKEALKKHLREIYAASRCADWQELARALYPH